MPPGTGTAIRFPSAQRQADLEMVLDGKVPPTGVHLPSFDLSGDPTVLVAPGHPTGCGSARWPGRWHNKDGTHTLQVAKRP